MSGETALTPGEFNEEWVVSVDREHFSLSGKQMGVLRSATVAGNRGLIFFDRFAISIPHISCAYLARRTPKNPIEAPKAIEEGILPKKEAMQKLNQIRQKLVETHAIN